jgi:hypothetical protein
MWQSNMWRAGGRAVLSNRVEHACVNFLKTSFLAPACTWVGVVYLSTPLLQCGAEVAFAVILRSSIPVTTPVACKPLATEHTWKQHISSGCHKTQKT